MADKFKVVQTAKTTDSAFSSYDSTALIINTNGGVYLGNGGNTPTLIANKYVHPAAGTGSVDTPSTTSTATTLLTRISIDSSGHVKDTSAFNGTVGGTTTPIYFKAGVPTACGIINYYPTTFAWTGGTTAGPTGSLTGSGMSAVSFGAIPTASGTASGIVTTGAQTFAGAKTFKDNITILADNNDRFINFKYSTTDLDNSSWRIGYKGSGSGDANNFAIQTNKTGEWVSALEFTLPGVATFSKTVTAPTFQGNLDWSYIQNKPEFDTYTHPTVGTTNTAADTSALTAVTLASGTEFTVVNGVYRDASGHVNKVSTTKYTMPASAFTDTKMTQTVSSNNATYPILLSESASTGTRGAIFGSTPRINPSTNKILGIDYIQSDSADIELIADEHITINGTHIWPKSANSIDIGGTNNRFKDAYFNGTVYAATSFMQSSDERLKDFGTELEVNLDELSKLRKSYFTFKDKPEDTQIGMSAQEIQKLYPEVVTETSDGYLNVDYSKLAVIALVAIDKLNEEIKELKKYLNL